MSKKKRVEFKAHEISNHRRWMLIYEQPAGQRGLLKMKLAWWIGSTGESPRALFGGRSSGGRLVYWHDVNAGPPETGSVVPYCAMQLFCHEAAVDRDGIVYHVESI